MMFWGEQQQRTSQHASISKTVALLLMITLQFIARPLLADPWVNAGNAALRHHLQYLHDQGRIALSLTSWPIVWADIDRELRAINIVELNDAEVWSYQYLIHERDRARKNATLDKTMLGSNSLRPFSSFGDIQYREQSFVRSAYSFHSGHIAGTLQTEYVFDPLESDDQHLRTEGSFLAGTSGNWAFGIGAIDRWWGPGWHTSLILSGSSRATAGVFLNRKESLASETPILKLIGKWNIQTFISTLEDDRPIQNAIFGGLRFTSNPFDNLEIGISRTAIADGETNPEYLTEEQTVEESYQLISYDARLTGYLFTFNTAIYGQIAEKRSDTQDDAESASLFGLEIAHSAFSAHNRLIFEIESQPDFVNNSVENSPHQDTQYPFGYSYRSRGIAETEIIGDKKLTVSGEHHFKGGQIFSWKWQTIDNVLQTPRAIADGSNSINLKDQQFIKAEYAFPIGEKLLTKIGAFHLKEKMIAPGSTLESGGYLSLHFRF